jgi:hypothetical protein
MRKLKNYSIRTDINLLVNEMLKEKGTEDSGMIKYIVEKFKNLIKKGINE